LDAKAYPIFETAALRAKANIFRQQLLANTGKIQEALAAIPEGDEIETFLSSLMATMKTFNLTTAQIISEGYLEAISIEKEQDAAARHPYSLPLLLSPVRLSPLPEAIINIETVNN
jgi:hypothetical protein